MLVQRLPFPSVYITCLSSLKMVKPWKPLFPLLNTSTHKSKHTSKQQSPWQLVCLEHKKGCVPNFGIVLLLLGVTADSPGEFCTGAGEGAALIGTLPDCKATARHALVAGSWEVVAIAVVGTVLFVYGPSATILEVLFAGIRSGRTYDDS